MSEIVELIVELADKDIKLYTEKGSLKVDAPKGALSEDTLQKIRSAKGELIAYLENNNKSGSIEIPVAKVQESYPLSSSQRRLWVLSQFEEGNVAYNMPFHIELDGTYDIELFKRSIYATIERHEILRTVFKEDEDGEIRQWVKSTEELGFSIAYKDFTQELEISTALKTYIREDSYRAFDLANGPLLRAVLLQVAADRYIFYYNMHHIISDGWSMEILARDILAHYDAYKSDRKVELPDLAIQYKDYACWQSEQLASGAFEEDKTYWLEQFKGELPVLELPSGKIRPQMKSNAGRTLGTYLDKETSSALKNYSQEQGGSLFMGLLASITVLFHRYTAQEDIILGSPIAGREHKSLSNQIGFYVNTLALRNTVKGTDSFDDLYERVKTRTLLAYKHQAYPFDELVEELKLKRDTSRSALFDVMLVLQNNGEKQKVDRLEEALIKEIHDYGYTTSKFDLLVNFEEIGDYLSFSIQYNPDIYEQETIIGFMQHYRQLLPDLLANTQEPISSIQYIGVEEQKLLEKMQQGPLIELEQQTVMELFEAVTTKNGEIPAVITRDKVLTYSELNTLSNRLANYLREQKRVTIGERLGVILERSAESIIALLAVMKSGACYVPIDPAYPQERIAFILEDAAISTVISQELYRELDCLNNLDFISLDTENFPGTDASNPRRINQFSDAAFIIYTSGSTGKPKGVVQTHQMLENLIVWEQNGSGIAGNLKLLQYVSFNFDVSLQNCWSVLCSGGSLFIAEESLRLDFHALEEYIIDREIEVLSFPFSALHNLFNDSLKLEGHCLKHIVSSGEQLLVNEHLDKFLRANPEVQLHNHYGPSETHVVTSHTMSYELNNIRVRPPIGKPICNTGIYVLDANLKNVPPGVRGEIYVDGANLSSGYINLPEDTAARFIQHPFKKGERIYKTGDLGYWQPNGELEYLGRADDQVKIRGYRIELGEVERVLERHPKMSSCAVLVHSVAPDEKCLLAYFVAEDVLSSSFLRKELGKVLPEYMVPAFFIQLKEIPLTTNGKLDKRALPAPEEWEVLGAQKYVAPRNEIEEQLVAIWQQLLAREKIGVLDNFFDLGGHSLKAIRLMNSINKHFGLRYDLRKIYMEPSIEEMAENISIIQDNYLINNEEVEEFRI